jgi:hypothetical protein
MTYKLIACLYIWISLLLNRNWCCWYVKKPVLFFIHKKPVVSRSIYMWSVQSRARCGTRPYKNLSSSYTSSVAPHGPSPFSFRLVSSNYGETRFHPLWSAAAAGRDRSCFHAAGHRSTPRAWQTKQRASSGGFSAARITQRAGQPDLFVHVQTPPS